MTAARSPLIRLEAADSVEITVLADNLTDVTLPHEGPALRSSLGALPDMTSPISGRAFDPLVAEHGFAAQVSIARGGQRDVLLFDAGGSPRGMVENMRRLELPPDRIQAVVLSHNHFDHTAGLDGLCAAVGRTALPALVHPGFWRSRRVSLPGQNPTSLPSPSRSGLADAGLRVTEDAAPALVFAGSALVTGGIPRTIGFEIGLPYQEARVGGRWVPDPLTEDEQALVVQVRDLGLVVLTACSHPGVINTVRYAQRLTGVQRIHAVIGGFHLNGPAFAPVIGPTVSALREIRPDWLLPGHCTGWRAHAALAAAFPTTCVPTAVGTRLTFPAQTSGTPLPPAASGVGVGRTAPAGQPGA